MIQSNQYEKFHELNHQSIAHKYYNIHATTFSGDGVPVWRFSFQRIVVDIGSCEYCADWCAPFRQLGRSPQRGIRPNLLKFTARRDEGAQYMHRLNMASAAFFAVQFSQLNPFYFMHIFAMCGRSAPFVQSMIFTF